MPPRLETIEQWVAMLREADLPVLGGTVNELRRLQEDDLTTTRRRRSLDRFLAEILAGLDVSGVHRAVVRGSKLVYDVVRAAARNLSPSFCPLDGECAVLDRDGLRLAWAYGCDHLRIRRVLAVLLL